jgi:tripartite-type tricarboxylate transporter receptor subunit TctC
MRAPNLNGTSMNRRQFLATGTAATSLASPALVRAQSGVTRIVVGFAAGAGVDAIARKLADKLQTATHTTFIVDNMAGAAGRMAAANVKHAAPDGRTILITPATSLTVLPHLQKNLGYDPLKDFVPVTSIASILLGWMVGRGAQGQTLAEYLQWARRDPKNDTYGSPGAGSISHFLGVMFAKAAKLDMVHVPYKGAAPAQQDLVSGQVPAYAGIIGRAVINEHRAGRIRILATSMPKRSALMPDIPTFVESGYPEVVATEWTGVFLPSQTPSPLVENLNRQVRAALQLPDMAQMLQDGAMEPAGASSADFAAQVRRELAAWEPIVKASGFRPDN